MPEQKLHDLGHVFTSVFSKQEFIEDQISATPEIIPLTKSLDLYLSIFVILQGFSFFC
jgi:hypothetical protein